MTSAATSIDGFETWLRTEFVALNTELEETYFAARTDLLTDPNVDRIRRQVVDRGGELVSAIDSIPDDPVARYQLLGAVGFYLAACRRHGADGKFEAAWSLATRLGTSLGVAPRYVFAHQSTFNPAVAGMYRLFTSLPDETFFVTYNGLAVLAYRRAADALRQIAPMGPSHEMTAYLLQQAKAGLGDVLRFERVLSDRVNVDRFFHNIRPYFKPYRVGAGTYRGANAGDFAAVNEIDLILGLCSPADTFYHGIVAEKYPYVPPDDQALLRGALSGRSLLDSFLSEATADPGTEQLCRNGELFREVCKAHAAAATFHHHRLVKPFLQTPAESQPPGRSEDLTASGPPLDVVVAGLERLVYLRSARDRPGIVTARASLTRLDELLNRR